jgi:aspartate racemase
MTAKLKRIGILGGSSNQATSDYYTRLNDAVRNRLGGWNTAELIITSMNFAFSADCVRNGNWDAMAEYLSDRARALEAGGADIFLCVSNTLHKVADRFVTAVDIPFLHIADSTGREIERRNLKTVSLLGTMQVMEGDHIKRRLANKFGIEIIVPTEEERSDIDRIIFDELCQGVFPETSKVRYLQIIDNLASRGAQGSILGCTEIPLLIAQSDRPDHPMFDTTGLHVEEAVQFSIGMNSLSLTT